MKLSEKFEVLQHSLEKCMDTSDEIVYILEKLDGTEYEKVDEAVPETQKPVNFMFLETQIDKITNLLESSKSVTIEDLMRKLGLKEECAHRWCKMLENRGVIEVQYPVFGKPVIKIVKNGHTVRTNGNGHRMINSSSMGMRSNGLSVL